MPDLIRAKPLREGLKCWLRSAAPMPILKKQPPWARQLQVQDFCWQPHKLARWPWASEEAGTPANTLVTALWGLSREGSWAMPRILITETVGNCPGWDNPCSQLFLQLPSYSTLKPSATSQRQTSFIPNNTVENHTRISDLWAGKTYEIVASYKPLIRAKKVR